MLMLNVDVKMLKFFAVNSLVLLYVVMKTELVRRLSEVVFKIALLSLWHMT